MTGVRRVWRVLMALWRFAKRRVPKWLLPILAVCLAIPGPLDELAVLAVVLVSVLRSRQARQELGASVKAAWRN